MQIIINQDHLFQAIVHIYHTIFLYNLQLNVSYKKKTRELFKNLHGSFDQGKEILILEVNRRALFWWKEPFI